MKHLSARALAGLLAVTLLSGCFGCRFQGSLTADLIAPPAASAALAVLKKGDLAEARRILEPKLAAKPGDAGLSYTLGCVDLLQSDQTADRSSKREMQTRGWQRVEAAAGRYYPADSLFSHAYRVGRWGKKRSHPLYLKHLRTTGRRYDFPHSEQDWDEIHRRTWAKLAPGEQTLFNEGGRLFRPAQKSPFQ